MIKKLLFVSCFLFIVAITLFFANRIQDGYVVLGENKVKVKIADEEIEWSRGLSDTKALAKNEGMLFVFPDKRIRTFWMKNMNYPLDIIWINDETIIKIDRNLPPEGAMPTTKYDSGKPINHVLEVNGGWMEKKPDQRGR